VVLIKIASDLNRESLILQHNISWVLTLSIIRWGAPVKTRMDSSSRVRDTIDTSKRCPASKMEDRKTTSSDRAILTWNFFKMRLHMVIIRRVF